MAVAPAGLEGVTADVFDVAQLEGERSQRFVRRLVNITHDIAFARATGARTRAPQFFQSDERFLARIPFDRELLTDDLDVDRFHYRKICIPISSSSLIFPLFE